VVEALIVLVASGVGGGHIWVKPGSVGSQVTLSCAYLVDSPRYKLPQFPESVWGEAGGVEVLGGCGVFGSPFFEE